MGLRLDLQAILQNIIGGSNNVHFQPPASTNLTYPCIIYRRNDIQSQFGDNIPYLLSKEYILTVIYKDPDSDLPDKIAKLPKCKSDQMFPVDNLYHAIFKIQF